MSEPRRTAARRRELEEEYRTVGRDLMRIRVQEDPRACGLDQRVKTTAVYACIFNAACVTMQDTLFLLQAEADELSAIGRIDPVTVLGVHEDWLEGGPRGGRRCLWVDGQGRCNDVVLDEPIRMDCVHFLHFGAEGEIEAHRRLTAEMKSPAVLLINPAAAASDICDSKQRTCQALRAAGLPAPETLFISQFSMPDRTAVETRVREFLRAAIQNHPGRDRHLFFIQPDRGSEARAAVCVAVEGDGEPDASVIDEICGRSEDTVVRYGRGQARTAPAAGGRDPAAMVVRINAYEGMMAESLSGYAIVAPRADSGVVAVSAGAAKVDLQPALEGLSFDQDVPPPPYHDLQVALCRAAQEVFQAVNAGAKPEEMILLLGIDFVLEPAGGQVRAVAIDVNPRAIIAHSTFSRGRERKTGLGPAYWQDVTARIRATRH